MMKAINRSHAPSTTFLYCAESGYFEAQTVLAIECLRKFGGKFSDCPVLVVTPRIGPTLTRPTLDRLKDLGAMYVRETIPNPYPWFHFMNKAITATIAEQKVDTEQIIWLDSDTLIVSEPNMLYLEPGYDIAISSTDKNIGTTGPEDKNECYWRALGEYMNQDIEQFPWVKTEFDQERVRLRVHSGVFSFRKDIRLGKKWLEACTKILDSKVAYSKSLPFPGDSVAFSFAAVGLKASIKLIPLTYNYEMMPSSPMYSTDRVSEAVVLHYHQTLTNSLTSQWFLAETSKFLPDLYEWIHDRVPLNTKIGGPYRRLQRWILANWRSKQKQEHLRKCSYSIS